MSVLDLEREMYVCAKVRSTMKGGVERVLSNDSADQ